MQNLTQLSDRHHFIQTQLHFELPLFTVPHSIQHEKSSSVVQWKELVEHCDGIIICTPEYIHSMPAVLKNALEWITESGELHAKKTMVISYTPHPPRGEKALQSLVWSLQALEAQIITTVSLYKNTIYLNDAGKLEGPDLELLEAALELI